MRKIHIVLLALVWGLFSVAHAQNEQVLNGGFEAGTFVPSDWVGAGISAASATGRICNIESAHSGLCGVRLSGARGGRFVTQILPVNPVVGDTLSLSFWAKAGANTFSANARVLVSYIDGTSDALQIALPSPAAQDWTLFAGTLEITKEVASVSVSVRNQGSSGVVWFDDVSVTF